MTREELIIDAITNSNECHPEKIRKKLYNNSGFELPIEEVEGFLRKIKGIIN